MHHPFELIARVARDRARYELAHVGGQDAIEAQVLPRPCDAIKQLRAAQQRQERPIDALARAVDQRLRAGALRIIHCIGGKHWEPLACVRRETLLDSISRHGKPPP
jgi:hypothetical protein